MMTAIKRQENGPGYEHTIARYRKLYGKLLRFYPKPYRERFGESMGQTFNDLCNERREARGGLFRLVLWMFVETSVGIIRENVAQNTMKNIAPNPKSAALVGFLFALPFLVMNTIVGNRIEPFYSLIRPPGTRPDSFEYVWLAVVLLLLPVGAFIAIRPIFQKRMDGKRKWYILNIALATVLLFGFVALTVGLGSEIYRCDVLQIPNCD